MSHLSHYVIIYFDRNVLLETVICLKNLPRKSTTINVLSNKKFDCLMKF